MPPKPRRKASRECAVHHSTCCQCKTEPKRKEELTDPISTTLKYRGRWVTFLGISIPEFLSFYEQVKAEEWYFND